MTSYKSVSFQKSPDRYRDDPLACPTEEDSLLYSPTAASERSFLGGSQCFKCYRRNRSLCIVGILAVALGVVCVREYAFFDDYPGSSLAMDLTDLPLLGAPRPRHDRRGHDSRHDSHHAAHHGRKDDHHHAARHHAKHHVRIEGRHHGHDRDDQKDRERRGDRHRHDDASGQGRHHHHGREASDEEASASDSLSVEDESAEDVSVEDAVAGDNVDELEDPGDSVDDEEDERSGGSRHHHDRHGRHKRLKRGRRDRKDKELEVLSCEELMIGVFEQECIAAMGKSVGTFASAPTGDGGLIGIGVGGRRLNKFSIGQVDLELQSDGGSDSLDAGQNPAADSLFADVLDVPAVVPGVVDADAPGAPDAPDAPDAGAEDAPDAAAPDDQQAPDVQEDSVEDQGEEDAETSQDPEDSEDDGPGYCMRTVTTSSEPGWVAETSVAKYSEMENDNSRIFWTWGGTTAVCSFRKLEGRSCRRELDKITRAFKRDDSVDLKDYSHRDLC